MSQKRSSMRQGPLSELFRKTEEEEAAAAAAAAPAEEVAPEPESVPSPRTTGSYVAVIRVVGVGGAGCNAVNRMVDAGVRGVEFVGINTDRQALDACEAEVLIAAGMDLTRGRGTGGDIALGEAAVRESEEQIRHALRGSDLVFVTAGQGGGTGTGGAPIVARIAREMGALTVAVVTKPFGFEGARRSRAAEAGIEAVKDAADTTIVIPNDRLMNVLDRSSGMVEAFGVCDDLLRQGVQGITDLITLPGLINLDFADIRTTISDAGTALLGIGYAEGETRAIDAAERAIESPLLETPIDGARSIVLGITGGPDLGLVEVSEAARVISDAADPAADIIFGATIDPQLDDQVWVTVVAADFSGRRAAPRRERSTAAAGAAVVTPLPVERPTDIAEPEEVPDLRGEEAEGEAGGTVVDMPYPGPGRDRPGGAA